MKSLRKSIQTNVVGKVTDYLFHTVNGKGIINQKIFYLLVPSGNHRVTSAYTLFDRVRFWYSKVFNFVAIDEVVGLTAFSIDYQQMGLDLANINFNIKEEW